MAPADGPEVSWIAPVIGNVCTITVKVSNEEKSSEKSKNITVRSFTEPVIKIVSPEDGDYVVQHSTVSIKINADHQNGIDHINFYINDTLQATLSGQNSTLYTLPHQFSYPAGEIKLKAEAIASITAPAGRDSIDIIIEGIVLKRIFTY